MRLVTWNINSLRLRLDLLRRLIQEEQPDVICLQEIKVEDSAFPESALRALGYPNILRHGMKGYNGVAILSRLPFLAQDPQDWCARSDSRHGRVVLGGDLDLQNFYVPAGGDVPDPARNAKFAHKLQFLDEMRDYFAGGHFAGDRPPRRSILVGDLNIAPLEHDVWSHKQLLDVVSHTPIEVEKLGGIKAAGKWVDAVRHFVPAPEKLFSWWSYRSPDWTKNDRGRRLDHIWVTPDLRKELKAARIRRDMRSWPQPSDHVAVVLDLK
jgi:exodeoxyribonuclease-3